MRRVLLVLLWLLALEAGARAYWWIDHGVPPWRADHLALGFYPELRHGLGSRADDEPFDVLLLGGSVLNFAADELAAQLEAALDVPVQVRNTAWPSHSSLDSLAKYEWLGGSRFDAVVFYHGVNEVRANNVPPERYRRDYSHYSWYRSVNALRAHREHTVTLLPFTLHHAGIALAERLGLLDPVPTHQPNPEWVRYGADVKTAASFRENLERIVALARAREEPLVLMTFAWFLPDDYSEERFRAGELSYTPGPRTHPVEIWGEPEHVVAGIRAHNAVIRDVGARHPEVLFVDQERLVPADGALFGDLCHFSEAGLVRFAENTLPALLAARERRP